MTLRLSGGRKLVSPPGETARPTTSRVRLAVMNLLALEIPGCSWLDLCCGSGAIACEALQRGAKRVVAVDQDRRIAPVARANLEAVAKSLGSRVSTEVVVADLRPWLEKGLGPQQPGFQVIYADPPYGSGLYGDIATAVLKGNWLSPGGVMVWECATSALPPMPPGWRLQDQRSYGTTSLMLLEIP